MRALVMILACMLLLPVMAPGQDIQQDFALLKNSTEGIKQVITNRKGLYQKIVQPQVGSPCIFETPCRDFRKGLFHEFGVVKAAFLTVDRWGRCSHLSVIESLPVRLNAQHKIIESPVDYRIRQ